VAGMCDSLGQRVRDAAAKLAVTVYATFGLDAMQPMLSGLRSAKQTFLMQKFEECELEYDDEFLDDSNGPLQSMPDLFLKGQSMLPASSQPLSHLARSLAEPVTLPGVPESDTEEECLMDAILEDTGMVFASSFRQAHGGSLSDIDPGSLFGADELEEQVLLEQLLMQQFGDLGSKVPRGGCGAFDLERFSHFGRAIDVY